MPLHIPGPDLYPWPRSPLTLPLVLRKVFEVGRAAAQWLTGSGRWRWLPESQHVDGLPIQTLIAPFRYDVLLRHQMIDLYLRQRTLYRSEFHSFVHLAEHHPYYVWYKKIYVRRYFPELLDRPNLLRAGYAHKLRRLADLFESLSASGFDERSPIELFAGARLRLPAGLGGLTPGFFLGDGCHRVATLLHLGRTTLPLGWYRVRVYQVLTPLDITLELVRQGALDRATYFRFLSGRYASPGTFTDFDALLEHVRSRRPESVAELRAIIRHHGFA